MSSGEVGVHERGMLGACSLEYAPGARLRQSQQSAATLHYTHTHFFQQANWRVKLRWVANHRGEWGQSTTTFSVINSVLTVWIQQRVLGSERFKRCCSVGKKSRTWQCSLSWVADVAMVAKGGYITGNFQKFTIKLPEFWHLSKILRNLSQDIQWPLWVHQTITGVCNNLWPSVWPHHM